MLLAYDQGFEHGPSLDFNDRNVDPTFIMETAFKGGFNGIVFQKGLAEKYYDGRVPLIVKTNGKAGLTKGEPNSKQNCSVEYAISLGAKAVGYTIYLGSQYRGGNVSGIWPDCKRKPTNMDCRQLRGSIHGDRGSLTILRKKLWPTLRESDWNWELMR